MVDDSGPSCGDLGSADDMSVVWPGAQTVYYNKPQFIDPIEVREDSIDAIVVPNRAGTRD
jgi:hypothetical protein